jgi:hypothetical protein
MASRLVPGRDRRGRQFGARNSRPRRWISSTPTKQRMSQTLLTAATPYATILMSGVVSTIVTYYLNRNKEHAFFMRSKAEALYLAADDYGRDFASNLICYFPVTREEHDYNKMLDLQQTNKPTKKHGGFETMTMLANIYFPETLPKL